MQWFAELATKWLRRGTHRSTRQLLASIRTLDHRLERRTQTLRLAQDGRRDLDTLANYCQRISDHVTRSLPTARTTHLVARPGNSSVNWFSPGQNVANGVTAAVDPSGRTKVRGGGDPTHVVIDAQGYLL